MTTAQQLPRAVHLSRPGTSTPSASIHHRAADGADSTCSPTPSCARRANRSARSRWNARSTNWRSELGIDPIELRAGIEPDDGPDLAARLLLAPPRARPIGDGAERFGWDRRNRPPRARREGEWLIGMGVATGDLSLLPHARRRGARSRSHADGHATVEIAAHEMGMGTATVQAQHAAERLGLPLEQVTFEYGDTQPAGRHVAGGSSQTAAIARGRRRGRGGAGRGELLKLAGNDSPLAGLRPNEVAVARSAGLRKVARSDAAESYASILARAQARAVEATADGADAARDA